MALLMECTCGMPVMQTDREGPDIIQSDSAGIMLVKQNGYAALNYSNYVLTSCNSIIFGV